MWEAQSSTMLKIFSICACMAMLGALRCGAQSAEAGAKPAAHIIGTVINVDAAGQAVTVKEDKTGKECTVQLGNTKTLLKVPPGAKDLKTASRITAEDLQVGDRVDVRGSEPEGAAGPETIAARSVVLMSARDLAQTHQQEAAAWQHSTAGIVNAVDASGEKLEVTARTPAGPKPVTVQVSQTTQFTRYSVENPKTPAPSQLSDIQPGDQVRVIGQKSEDGATISAQKIYSGAFRTLAATVSSIGADGKQLTVKDLLTKQPIEVGLTEDSAIRKLPPEMAMGLARRLNPDLRAAAANGGPQNGGNAGGAPPNGAKAAENAGPAGDEPARSAPGNPVGNPSNGGAAGGQGTGRMRASNGDLSQMLERVPKISLTDLKPGDAVVISGVAEGADKSRLLASSIIAGVEPIFQSAPAQQSRSLGDWSLDMQAPAQQ